jgi:pilus assembly protein CpaE
VKRLRFAYGFMVAKTVRQPVYVVTEVSDVADAVGSAFEQNGRFALAHVCRDFDELVGRLRQTPAAAVLIDLGPEPKERLARLDLVTREFANTRFIVLVGELDNDLMLGAMEAGARHVMLKDAASRDLANVLHRLVPATSLPAGNAGRVTAVLGTSGGCGATTVAVHLADELPLLSSNPVLLADFDVCYGGVASYLGIQGQYGIADVLARQGEIDPQLIRTTALIRSESMHVLLSPATTRFADPMTMDYSRLADVLDAARQTYHDTVIDAPRVPMPIAVDLARVTDQVLLVMQATVKDIQTAKMMVAGFHNENVPRGHIVCVVNRFHKRKSMVTMDAVRRALPDTALVCIRNDYQNAIKSLNLGQPLAQSAPLSGCRRDIRKLAADLFDESADDRLGMVKHERRHEQSGWHSRVIRRFFRYAEAQG